MSWQDWGDVRKARGSVPTGKKRGKGGLSAKDAKHIARTDPDYKSVDKKQRKAEMKRGDNQGRKKAGGGWW